jgi:hypothetical protein
VEWPPLNGGADRYTHLAIGPDIAQQRRVKLPHFQFDEAETRAQDFTELQALARGGAPRAEGRASGLQKAPADGGEA